MPPEPTAEERVRAVLAAHHHLLDHLWTFVLAEMRDPIEEFTGARERTLELLEQHFENAEGREFTVTREVAIAYMEGFWTLIRAELASLVEPPNLAPTEYGRRLANRASRGRSSADPSAEAPDR